MFSGGSTARRAAQASTTILRSGRGPSLRMISEGPKMTISPTSVMVANISPTGAQAFTSLPDGICFAMALDRLGSHGAPEAIWPRVSLSLGFLSLPSGLSGGGGSVSLGVSGVAGSGAVSSCGVPFRLAM